MFAGAATLHPDLFWLDAGPAAVSGWSWLGVGSPAATDDVRAVRCGGAAAEAGPFHGGYVGWLGYEDGAERAGAPIAEPDAGIPSSAWLRADRFVGFDHATRTAWVFAEDAEAFARELDLWDRDPAATLPPSRAVRARHEPAEYAELVTACRAAIREGDAYQLCLTTRFEVDGVVDDVSAYLNLRRATPAHHGGFIRIDGVALASASPERFLEVQDGVVRTHPIKGTRPRGTDAASDAALKAELRASPKERAENVMIVDLMRNDLARVADTGTVVVENLLEVESYPAVHQLVSAVAARIAPGTTVGRLWDAAFPAGSMTGAPKLSAMTILHRLEGAPRGVFAGCFGWVGDDGGMDLAMVIRSIVVHRRGAYVGAGGGITWGSIPADEVAEVGVKARAPLAALGASLPPGW
ncbi:anthranilate synthase component I family protein [Microbacterium sp. ASV49]|uniref:Anthranilate synthase component I family protein n=1 Tax=Microbacterium candidum TaxID=3041922 RepID=A0ABT7MYV9_9MICO|nr:anthranilate synthase component I family protein [Microbacterium sp. ASV49]MDL9979634.1 anthranilate synthase component I family protein [Microbacterium sp. ASV49]